MPANFSVGFFDVLRNVTLVKSVDDEEVFGEVDGSFDFIDGMTLGILFFNLVHEILDVVFPLGDL